MVRRQYGSPKFDVRIPNPLVSRFRKYLKQTGKTASEVIRAALVDYLDGKEEQKSR